MDITKMKYVLGYQLKIRPTNYEVDITTAGDTVFITNVFTVSKDDKCCIPFCCLSPPCEKRKTVVDKFTLDGDRLILQSTSAFKGLINCCEKGKVFQLIEVGRYLVLVNEKEVFIYSDVLQKIHVDTKYKIEQQIKKCDIRPKKLDIVFLEE